MASILKQPNGRWRAAVFRKGARATKVFITKREAEAWAAAKDVELSSVQAIPPGKRYTLSEAMVRYRDTVSTTKRGERWEALRINAFLASGLPMFSKKIGDVSPDDIGAWRDYRLGLVSGSSVNRELALVSSIFETARREWRWIAVNPVKDVRKPKCADHRETIITQSQVRTMCRALGYTRGPAKSVRQAVAVCFLVALRSGCRAGELTSLAWPQVHERFFTVSGKTGKRDVPLTRSGRRLFEQMRGFDGKTVFGLTPQTLDALFRKARSQAGLSGFTFHDSRHTAATRLVKKFGTRIDVLTFCKMMGWKDPKMAMTYYNPTATQIASVLEG